MALCIWIPSVHPDSLWNPAFLRASSTASVIHETITLHRILLGTDRRVIPCQILQLLNAPFFGIPIVMPLFHSSLFHPRQTAVKTWVKMEAPISGSALHSSAFRLSCPRGFTIVQGFNGSCDHLFSRYIHVDVKIFLSILNICLFIVLWSV